MSRYQVAWNAATRVATVQLDNAALPGGSTKIGEFDHDDIVGDGEHELDLDGPAESHVMYHHVRDLLYPLDVWDMSQVTIVYKVPESITATPNPINIADAATAQLVPVVLPADAVNKTVSYTSADPAIATVSAAGLVTGISPGVTSVTIRTVNGLETVIPVTIT